MGLQLMFPKMETCVLTSREVAPKTIKSIFLGIVFCPESLEWFRAVLNMPKMHFRSAKTHPE